MRRVLLIVTILMGLTGVAYAGGGGHFSLCPGFSEGSNISMLDSCFSGTAHFAPAGTAIRISNDGQFPHDLTAVDGSFATGLLEGGQSTDLTFDQTGIYKIYCTIHGTASGEGMAGILVVGEPAPGVVAASMDLGPVESMVTDQGERILSAMDNQGRAMGKLTAAQDEIVAGLAELSTKGFESPSEAPQVVIQNPGQGLNMAVGLAVGLALAALVGLAQVKRREGSSVDLQKPVREI